MFNGQPSSPPACRANQTNLLCRELLTALPIAHIDQSLHQSSTAGQADHLPASALSEAHSHPVQSSQAIKDVKANKNSSMCAWHCRQSHEHRHKGWPGKSQGEATIGERHLQAARNKMQLCEGQMMAANLESVESWLASC
jgi:hypothetical protein